jgi:hypothetical protein
MKTSVFWHAMPGSLVDVHERFGGLCCLHLPDMSVYSGIDMLTGTGAQSKPRGVRGVVKESISPYLYHPLLS